MSKYFPKPMNLTEILTLKLTCLILQQKQIPKIFRILIFALKSNLASLKAEVKKLYINELVSVLVDLSKLSDAVKNDVIRKTVDNKLVWRVNSIETSRFALKTKYDTDKRELENKIPDSSELP